MDICNGGWACVTEQFVVLLLYRLNPEEPMWESSEAAYLPMEAGPLCQSYVLCSYYCRKVYPEE